MKTDSSFKNREERRKEKTTYLLRFQLLLKHRLPLMQSTEAIDLLLIFTTDFCVLTGRRGLVLFRELVARREKSVHDYRSPDDDGRFDEIFSTKKKRCGQNNKWIRCEISYTYHPVLQHLGQRPSIRVLSSREL